MKEFHEIFFKTKDMFYANILEIEPGTSHEEVEKLGQESLEIIERFKGHDFGIYQGYRIRFRHQPWEYFYKEVMV
jgi:hypothetical protein